MAKYEPGKYEVKIVGQGFTPAQTGNMQFFVEFAINGRIDPANPQNMFPVAPGTRKLFRTLTENTVQWIMDDLRSMGVEYLHDWLQLDPTAEHPSFIDLSGRVVEMTCGQKAGQGGKMYEDWAIARTGGGKPIERAASNDVKKLNRMFGSVLTKAPAARAVPTRAASAAAVADDPSNDPDLF